MFLFQKIEEIIMIYKDARASVAEFVLQEKDNLHKYTINEVAYHSYTSKATVVRFAKTLGFEGWRDFIKEFIYEVKYHNAHKDDVDANYPFSEKSSLDDIIEGIKQVQIESIKDTVELLDKDMIKISTNYLEKARRVVIFGLAPNIFLGELFRRKMITIGKQVDIARPGEMGIISRMLDHNDCAIFISYSGNSKISEPMSHLQLLLDNKVPIIGITSGGDNYIRRKLSCVITISSKEKLYTKISNFATEESIHYILNLLFSSYFVRNFNNNNITKLNNSKILEQSRSAVLNSIKE